ncbi:hypothetical protein QBC33DRAFT_514528 [Phialemonium atrogriseum]|uniref:Uncharacterized protein n=1 Tax=Phialemonium atrogriseum TaxID=1093897 RepID=A0AAJ0C5Y3_9PEZI|nr:uncharacterized protein QBC33DRAFT_514528 [Phialemonium atrogriseum]KAK1768261.1 hypothetical protein QBC33DRAFT_514528 [Phialemonium atrogriseum]
MGLAGVGDSATSAIGDVAGSGLDPAAKIILVILIIALLVIAIIVWDSKRRNENHGRGDEEVTEGGGIHPDQWSTPVVVARQPGMTESGGIHPDQWSTPVAVARQPDMTETIRDARRTSLNSSTSSVDHHQPEDTVSLLGREDATRGGRLTAPDPVVIPTLGTPRNLPIIYVPPSAKDSRVRRAPWH